jgi:ABC-type nitrate/sulfonate/bicarbonate transport system ATPase subunit
MLAAAFASGASLTLLEKPFAALDARSRALLSELLQEAAAHPARAWVLADYQLPETLAQVDLATTLDLGD